MSPKAMAYNPLERARARFAQLSRRTQNFFAVLPLSLAMLMPLGCASNPAPVKPLATYILTVNSTNPASGVAIAMSGVDLNGAGSGTASFTRSFTAGTSVSLTAPATEGSNYFASWTGCSSVSGFVCTVAMNGNATVTANYAAKAVYSVTISPAGSTSTIGSTVQFAATVTGAGTIDKTVTWSIAAPASSTLSPGTITNLSSTSTSQGLYTTPYPAPATVTVTATSNQDSTKFANVVVTLNAPAATVGPPLSVDAGNQTRPISPDIYGMNSYPQIYGTNHYGYNLSASGVAKSIALPVDRWNSPTYNYKYDSNNVSFCCYFLNSVGDTNDISDNNGGLVNTLIAQDEQTATKTMVNVPILGWTSKGDITKCSFSVAKYGPQQMTDPKAPNTDCGNGIKPDGKTKIVNDPNDALLPADTSFVSGWVKYLSGKFGTAANGGVAIYQLDNEPDTWEADSYNEQPNVMTYDLLTNNSLSYAAAIKSADPTAQVFGPVISSWDQFFYSTLDFDTGVSSLGGPCYCYNGNPIDRLAHGDIPLIEYYLQQFQAYETAHGTRLLDYLDLHTYFASNGLSLNNAAGDTTAQQERLNSTRAMWDPTYNTDPNFTDPNVTSNPPLVAPMVIPLMRGWIAKDYPGTKTAITEYNWGGFDGVTGVLAQADLFGIFGREGLDLATLWNPPDPSSAEAPGLNAFKIYRNYDGNLSQFGDMALASTSGNQGSLAVYGARRTADHAVTIVVINKTYGDLTSTLSLANLTANGPAKVFLYSNANLASIVPQASITVTAPPNGSTTSSLINTFPAQSITLLVVPTN
jgi:hypothetical protein